MAVERVRELVWFHKIPTFSDIAAIRNQYLKNDEEKEEEKDYDNDQQCSIPWEDWLTDQKDVSENEINNPRISSYKYHPFVLNLKHFTEEIKTTKYKNGDSVSLQKTLQSVEVVNVKISDPNEGTYWKDRYNEDTLLDTTIQTIINSLKMSERNTITDRLSK